MGRQSPRATQSMLLDPPRPAPSVGRHFKAACCKAPQRLAVHSPGGGSERSSYELVVAELLLQQTRAEQAAKVFPALVGQCPDWLGLASMPRADLEELLRPLGLQRRRSAALQALARMVLERGLPASASELEALPGVGQYIARAIAAQLSNEVVAPIDTNVARVLERVFGPRRLADIRHDPELQGLALSPSATVRLWRVTSLPFSTSHQLYVGRGAPRCHECPVPACRYWWENMNPFPQQRDTIFLSLQSESFGQQWRDGIANLAILRNFNTSPHPTSCFVPLEHEKSREKTASVPFP